MRQRTRTPLAAELLLARRLDAVEHRELVAVLGDLAVGDHLLQPFLQRDVVRGDVEERARPGVVVLQQPRGELEVVLVDVALLRETRPTRGSRYAPFTSRIAEPSATSSSMSFSVR